MFAIIIGAVLLTAIDQVSKFLAVANLKPVGNITVIDGFF